MGGCRKSLSAKGCTKEFSLPKPVRADFRLCALVMPLPHRRGLKWHAAGSVDLDIDMQTLISRNGAHNLIKNMRLDFGMSAKVRV
eukprot:COSAG01_NODE_2432_length_7707_cov_17.497240_5_plen_85_part_00